MKLRRQFLPDFVPSTRYVMIQVEATANHMCNWIKAKRLLTKSVSLHFIPKEILRTFHELLNLCRILCNVGWLEVNRSYFKRMLLRMNAASKN